MSAERLSLGLNSLIPETYKSKAEAFAKCLQHKLLSLGRVDPPEPLNGGPRRPNSDAEGASAPHKTDDSEEEFCSHSESEASEPGGAHRKLTSMSSEDSTVESWGSCQENLTDVERLDSEAEEVSALAAQVKGSPKLRTFSIRAKRKEARQKTWKKNPRRNHSSSTESVDSEGARLALQGDDFDREFSSQHILLDGLEPEEDVPHRILRESSSTSSLERHFSCREDPTAPHLLTPPPSPDLHRKPPPQDRPSPTDLNSRIHFAQISTDSQPFHEVQALPPPNFHHLSTPVRKLPGLVLESPPKHPPSVVLTSVQVLRDDPTDIRPTEDDDILASRASMRRCSSLKSCKTPPGTPGAKKIVRFADALGLDLADVRTFLDDVPKVPTSAFDDLHFDLPAPRPPAPPPTTLRPLFRPPAAHSDLLHRLRTHNICLESTLLALDGVPTLTGFVRVRNLAFHKAVHVRYTLDRWRTFSDLQATYVPNSSDGFSDSFSFALYGHTLAPGDSLEFALRLDCAGGQYWDNNGGGNYVLQCLPQSPPGGYFPCSGQLDPWFDFY